MGSLLAVLESGAPTARACVARKARAYELLLSTRPGPGRAADCAWLAGWNVALPGPGDQGDAGGLRAARSIRRALADGRLKAIDVAEAWVDYAPAGSDAARLHAADAMARAFGPYADRVRVHLGRALGANGESGVFNAIRCVAAIADGRIRVGLVVSMADDGATTALAFSAPR